VVESIHLYEESGRARLAVVLLPGSDGMQVREFKNPRRIVIDVARSEDADAVQSARRRSLEAPPAPDKSDADIDPAQMRGDPVPAGETSFLAEKAAEVGKAVAAASSAAQAAVGITESAPPASGKVFRIAIDAGHGGKDGGAVGRRGTLEKDINLKAAEELAGLLRQEGMFEVFLTRSDDTFVKLGQRSQLANKSNADLFVSIHCNAHTSRKESGFEIYFLSERASDPEAERLAEFENSVLALEGDEDLEGGAASVLYALAKTEFINDAAELAGLMTQSLARRVDLPNRGVRQAAFYVLRGTNSPAVLVEMGFLSNARDEAKLQSRKYRSKIVAGLYAGIVEFAKRHQPERRKQ
jgi:N-acetylmuramoyl-L-alanine amidase